MKPLRLILQAFGPFAGREEIDFTLLPAGSLFLISGPTGAGKTSILDGITCALYGDTSGGERSAREMRSHHADPAMLTEVEFEFALGSERYRVQRTPEQERPAQRATRSGDSMVKVPAKAALFRFDAAADGDGWVPLSSKSTEVTQEVTRLLGFEAEQFRQVVLLPQGQFRKLLAAGSGEREKILVTLFGTIAYKRVQDALKAEAAALSKRAEHARMQRQILLEQAGVDSAEALAAQRLVLDEALRALAEDEKHAREADLQARSALQAARALDARFVEREAAVAAMQSLEARQPEAERQRSRLGIARKAVQVLPADRSLSDARQQAKSAREAVTMLSQQAGRLADVLSAAMQALAHENAEDQVLAREAAQREVLRLEGLAEKVEQLARAEVGLQSLQKLRAGADAALAAAMKDAEALGTRRLELVQRIEALQPQAAGIEALGLRLKQAEQHERARQNLAQQQRKRDGFHSAEATQQRVLDQATAARDIARQAFEALDATWRQAQGAILAHHLHDGAPCPVCGSAEHPAPARYDGELPTEAALKAAREAVSRAEKAHDGARTAFDTASRQTAIAQAEVDALQSALSASAGEDGAVPDSVAMLREQLQAATAAQTELAAARSQLATLETAQLKAAAMLDEARAAVSKATSEEQGAKQVVDERRAAVPEPLRAPAALGAALEQARARRQTLERALSQAQSAHSKAVSEDAALRARQDELQKALASATRREADAAEAFVAALAATGFADEPTYRDALLEPAAIDMLAAELSRFDDNHAAARERRKLAEAAIEGQQRPDLVALEAMASAQRERLEVVLGELGQRKVERDRIMLSLNKLAEIARETGSIEAEYRVAGHLAAIANGENGRNLTFQRYVLAALLDDVLRAASLRLRAMSRGRYLLQRRDEVADARRAAGLDLEVMDDYTGRARPVSTLSGGEGFMASLALALGLSDVVQAYAGGVQLDTLFIDEGFGSLDPESLDMAMKALIDLQQRGRMVGVISHVDEMKQQIDVAIDVVQGVRGSRVRIRA
ncbi:DNA repair exonuclease [Parazoarcus communis]|uniref:DNA repair exonuclease n=1 Tax=Parazoarcus communis TaxID=41977 RepID=A0A2U8GRN8_9RHOO|nr:SMC family ATPase [Parazoarcus communis]AWI76174.1 DNA repair exonuclease [Parazoarcus communis]